MMPIYKKEPKLIIEPKNILDELIYHELSKLDEILQVLEDLKIVIPEEGWTLTESDGYCWIEREPSEEEKKRVLAALGYDVSKL